MTMEDYDQAVKLMARYVTKQHFSGSKSENLIQKAERKLALTFPPTYRRFVLEYGAGSFGSSEIYGVIDEDFEHASVPDAIWYTLSERDESGLPHNLVVIANDGAGTLFCLDCKSSSEMEGYPVITFEPGYSLEEQKNEIVARDFGEYLLKEVLWQIERLNR
jgi:hypothetical protein